MNLLVTLLLAVVIVALVALIVLPPLRAVREDRDYAVEERTWLDGGKFPAEVERIYRQPRLLLTDGGRLSQLGYQLVERRRVRGPWGRLLAARWRATGPPARPAQAPAGDGGETTSP